MRDVICERVRVTVPRIERERCRIRWALGRMQRAEAADDRRAYEHAQTLGEAAQTRLARLWATL
ncbi:hypothetical protein OPKNFCMD_4089 [Methylobacterium crusticola]|uniref:Uncharacterized protein n=1 Tax=Methylobacterium crusticola TaxID=1697972 RepID=A0ABQ4R2F8_9HYPH|nr:hypothetical protein [Methylobacterium crusticola]GJD51335.1 hypothetical protein OPKNFCMD_4089 [Methylobacterium crusticola]